MNVLKALFAVAVAIIMMIVMCSLKVGSDYDDMLENEDWEGNKDE